MTPQQQTTLWLGSFRYYLGRMSYAVSDFCELLISQWHEIPEQCQKLIIKELEEAFKKDDEMRADENCSPNYYPLGMDMDRKTWEKVRQHYGLNELVRINQEMGFYD